MVGVSAGTGAMGSLLGKLTTLLSGEYKLLKGVRKEIEFLKRELERMQILLEKLAEMEGRLDGLARAWRDSVRDLSYDMEDCIDRFMDRLGSGDAKRGFMKRTARLLKTVWARHDIGTQIKELKARVMEESERRDRYKLDESCYDATRTVEIDPRIIALHEEVNDLVAMDGRVKHITALLMDASMDLKVVPIVGSGGMGKTTLAMEVYRKIGLGGDFQCRASVSVSRTLDLQKLLKDILSQIDDKECPSEDWNIDRLIRKTAQILTGKRYFIVIDDVWKEEHWKLVKSAFPENNNGSRIIATTRITRVANGCCSNSRGEPYQMAPLDDVDSQKLFFKRIFRVDDPCPVELEEVSTMILKKCGGLPLAIITFASLLASKKHNKDEWERLQDSIGMGSLLDNDGNLKGMKDILLLSYWDLPHHLKTCLLYLCIYPEDYKIKCKELKWKWMAEGFLDRRWGRLDEVAENCINELVNRNMIQPIDIGDDGTVKYCRVHDMVLDLIISLSDEENFAIVLNGRICNSFPNKIRRLSMQSSGKEHNGAVRVLNEAKLHVRSLTIFEGVKQIPPIVDFHALRVLDLKLDGYHWLENKHVKNIENSHQLRYLRIGRSEITELPSGIGKLQHLETLDLRYCYSLVRLPSTVAQLKKLVRLCVNGNTQLPASVFRSLQALEKLSFEKTDDPVRFVEEINESGECNLCYLRTNGKIAERLFCNPCCTYPCLLKIQISMCEMVPRGMASLKNVVKLRIMVMPCLVAKNWALNWLFRIGDPNSSVWLYSELKCGIQNQFRGTTPARPTYPFANSEVQTSEFAPNRPVARSFSLPKNRRTKVRAFLPCAGQGEDGGAARWRFWPRDEATASGGDGAGAEHAERAGGGERGGRLVRRGGGETCSCRARSQEHEHDLLLSVKNTGEKGARKSFDLRRNWWNWMGKICGSVDQHQRHQSSESKPQKT